MQFAGHRNHLLHRCSDLRCMYHLLSTARGMKFICCPRKPTGHKDKGPLPQAGPVRNGCAIENQFATALSRAAKAGKVSTWLVASPMLLGSIFLLHLWLATVERLYPLRLCLAGGVKIGTILRVSISTLCRLSTSFMRYCNLRPCKQHKAAMEKSALVLCTWQCSWKMGARRRRIHEKEPQVQECQTSQYPASILHKAWRAAQ